MSHRVETPATTNAVRERLRDDGWLAYQVGASLLVALKAGHRPRLVKVSADPRRFGGPARAAQCQRSFDSAERAGAEAWLAWWPCSAPDPEMIDAAGWAAGVGAGGVDV